MKQKKNSIYKVKGLFLISYFNSNIQKIYTCKINELFAH